MEQIVLVCMHAEGHTSTERAAADLCIEVLTLSRDMAFLGHFRKSKQDWLKSIYRHLGTIRNLFHIQACEYVHF
jgi:hypothetical protein